MFHQQRKGLVQVVRIRVAEPPSDTGAVGKVMQPVAFLYQTGTKTGRHGAGCVFRSIRSRIGIEVRSAIRIHSINRELNFSTAF
ncbi:hypothetical protein O5624_17395 [Escherichia coli]|nr:hypothetical protein [Escherichia coli]